MSIPFLQFFAIFSKKNLVCETRTIKQELHEPINPVCLCRINNKIVYWKKLTGSKTGELLQKTGSNWKVNGNHGLWLAMTNLEKIFHG